jgi:hypothetical protein
MYASVSPQFCTKLDHSGQYPQPASAKNTNSIAIGQRNQKGTSNISREGGWRLLEHGPVAFPKRQSDRQREYAELRTDPSSAWCLVIQLIGEILRNALRSKV